MHVLFIGIGENNLYENIGGSLDRHLRYTLRIGQCSTILINRKVKLQNKTFGNFSVYPTNSASLIKILWNSVILLKKIYRKDKIDIISCQDPFITATIGLFGKFILGIPLHIQNHSSFIDNQTWIHERPLLFKILNFIAKINIGLADRLRVVNSDEKAIYISKLKINANKIDVAPVPIDADFWKNSLDDQELQKFKKKFGLENKKITLGWAGRFVQFKNIPLLFEIVSKLNKNKIQLIMAGNNNESFYNLNELVEKYSIEPIFTGLLGKDELRCFYKSLDIYIHTSNYEGFGLVVGDALANGIPVISTNVAGSRDLIKHSKNGFISKNIGEFINYINLLVENSELRSEMANNALSFANGELNYNAMEDKVINSILKTLEK